MGDEFTIREFEVFERLADLPRKAERRAAVAGILSVWVADRARHLRGLTPHPEGHGPGALYQICTLLRHQFRRRSTIALA